jgi:hypothetical protein
LRNAKAPLATPTAAASCARIRRRFGLDLRKLDRDFARRKSELRRLGKLLKRGDTDRIDSGGPISCIVAVQVSERRRLAVMLWRDRLTDTASSSGHLDPLACPPRSISPCPLHHRGAERQDYIRCLGQHSGGGLILPFEIEIMRYRSRARPRPERGMVAMYKHSTARQVRRVRSNPSAAARCPRRRHRR